MDFLNLVKNLFYTPSEDWFFTRLPDAQTPKKDPGIILDANQYYLRIDLKSLRIVNVRIATSTFYGVVNSFINLPMKDGTTVEFNGVTTPSQLEKLDSKNLDHVIQVDIPILGQAPYRGADISLQLGLFSVKQSDLTEPIISLFTDMSKTAGVEFIGAALPYAKYLSKGISILSGTNNNCKLEIGIKTTLSEVKTGFYVVVGAPKEKIKVADLKISPNDYKLTDKNGKPIKDYPYLVYEISASKVRKNWFMIPEIQAAYSKLQKSVGELRSTDAANDLIAFKIAVKLSKDLLPDDGNKIIENVVAETQDVLAVTQTDRRVSPERRETISFTNPERSTPRQLKNLSDFEIFNND